MFLLLFLMYAHLEFLHFFFYIFLHYSICCEVSWIQSKKFSRVIAFLSFIHSIFVLAILPDLSRKVSGEVTKPTYGCQVTIHSEQEKQMMKMYRREEKRERKRGKGTEDSDFSDAVMTFDPREMRVQRYIISPKTFSKTLPCPLSLFSVYPFCALRYQHQNQQASAFFMATLLELYKIKKKKQCDATACHVFFFFGRGFFWKFNFRGWKKRAAICLIKNLAWPNPAQCEGKD